MLPPDGDDRARRCEQIRFAEFMERLVGSPDLLGTGVLDDTERDELFELLCTRRLDHTTFPFVHLDFACVDPEAATIESPGWFLTATGQSEAGDPEALGVAVRGPSRHPSWLPFLLSLEKRGLGGVLLVTAPAGERVGHLVPGIFPGARWESTAPGWRPSWMGELDPAADALGLGPDGVDQVRK